MFFEPDEFESFEAAKDLLIDRCDEWARGLPAHGDPFILSAALDFRHDSTDGRLGFWTAGLVRQFLLEWMPRRLSVAADDVADAPETLGVLLRFLRETDLDDPTGDPMPVLEDAIAEATASFRQAMSDERNFGLAKFWMMKAMAAGVDPTDQAGLEHFTGRVRAGEIAHDREVLAEIATRQFSAASSERGLPVLPVALPSAAELAASAGQSPVLAQVRALVAWTGTGRQLTTTGNIKLADARELVELLSTGDVIDPVFGGQTFRTTSSAELTGLAVIVEWAKKVRVVRVVKNRLVVVAKAKRLLGDDLALWTAAFEAVGELGDVLFPRHGWHVRMLGDVFDEVLPDVLNAIYGLPVPIPVVRLEESVWEACGATFAIEAVDEERLDYWRQAVARDLHRVLRLLTELGAAELSTGRADPMYSTDLDTSGSDYPDDPDYPDDLVLPSFAPEVAQRIRTALEGDTELVALTALGTSAVRSRLLADGRFAPLVGELSGASAGQLLGMIAEHYTPDTGREEIGYWLAAHPSDGHDRLLDAVRGCPFRTRAVALLDTLADAQPDRHGFLNRLRTDPVLAPTVLQLLISDGQLEIEELSPSDGLLGMTEQFLQLLELGGAEGARESLAEVPDLTELAYALEHSGHPDTNGLQRLRTQVIEPLMHKGPRRLHSVGGSQRQGRENSKSKRRHQR
ncbi:hypothetical protein [Kribbella catacumbae]|uniref:hypothetical protein n=1 Tax=Kribbella catacumbae TaxID=460086 RepID=UPI000378C731|nr:hypothetical protein [Kribbella catacumbae]